MSNFKIWLNNRAVRDAVARKMESAGVKWTSGCKPTEWVADVPCAYIVNNNEITYCKGKDVFRDHINKEVTVEEYLGIAGILDKIDYSPIKVGDAVKVLNSGDVYSTYRNFFLENALSVSLALDWVNGAHLDNTDINAEYDVVYIGHHLYTDEPILLIRSFQPDHYRQVYLIGIKGVVKCKA